MSHPDTYVFLDFDGVTHPWRDVEDFRSLPLIEQVAREFDELRFVITSDWRTLYSLPRLRTRFAEDVRERVIGTTPLILPRAGGGLYGLREHEARSWLAKHARQSQRWFAIDDAPGNWPTRARLILTDFKQGFMDEDAARMRQMAQAMREGAWDEAQADERPGFWPRFAFGGGLA
ncbi:hypothetical protein G3580_15195 [Nitrogeniibacter mangrovi]|uniref:HAD family hydrolase n=1 Tax=Nitrogeniibacter mangrovi TaxID=2016596 RepID=A0A6C1B803_9RHOO|nr:HAD domain-containing protein [Nitrogeniibacter mangrovi]QID18848.1 hypothetical protein G3580_15195 [Nitrogeniibacter mangrovi]